MLSLNFFNIIGLYGTKDIRLQFENNRLIIVGENGSGKTTVLRLFYYFISCQWDQLLNYNFDKLVIKFESQKELDVSRKEILNFFEVKNINRRLPPQLHRSFMNLLEKGMSVSDAIEKIENDFGFPMRRMRFMPEFDTINYEEQTKRQKNITEYLHKNFDNTSIMYLPTYRRIEQDLEKLFGDHDSDLREYRGRLKKNSDIGIETAFEVIEFGMDDVSNRLNSVLKKLQQETLEKLNRLTLAYLKDIVERNYANIDYAMISETTDEIIDKILIRVDDKILPASSKQTLKTTLGKIRQMANTKENISEPSDQVICHYFIKLLSFHDQLEAKEKNIREFFSVCNKYLEDKKFDYDSASHTYKIISYSGSDSQDIELKHLSSGEKQIIAMFSYMYLSENQNYFIIIDEPELSLSVKWQKCFLADVNNGNFCSGILAVTHSPFIYENDLQAYAHGINEFIFSKKQ